ncbi:MAG: 4-hydroxythreonine-4-phosphate dehydrogenase PdxA [Desulfuromonadaceae bacterium]|nr:4-hydroxythreonine-4-phosphate dehydrogenase PdxA [Desulfuromonadaceae bacterium]
MDKPFIITMGDPAGIGPEIIIQALLTGTLDADSNTNTFVVAGDVAVLCRAAAIFGYKPVVGAGVGAEKVLEVAHHRLRVMPLSQLSPAHTPFGHISAANGRAMLDYIEWACGRCRAGAAAGMITAPIQKEAIHAAGCEFPGHTELLAQRCGVEKVVMMLAGPRLKVCLVTTHLALKDVPTAVTTAEIVATLKVTHAALKRYFCPSSAPRIAVLALNPHAGEGGMFGDEEERIIVPALEQARKLGIQASGPHSADTLFHFALQGAYDAVVCMYHDQGLIPLKLLHFDDGVNVTLGLPIIRTSVDHGTAYDLAGSGRASAQSLIAAVNMAVQMSAQDRKVQA